MVNDDDGCCRIIGWLHRGFACCGFMFYRLGDTDGIKALLLRLRHAERGIVRITAGCDWGNRLVRQANCCLRLFFWEQSDCDSGHNSSYDCDNSADSHCVPEAHSTLYFFKYTFAWVDLIVFPIHGIICFFFVYSGLHWGEPPRVFVSKYRRIRARALLSMPLSVTGWHPIRRAASS